MFSSHFTSTTRQRVADGDHRTTRWRVVLVDRLGVNDSVD